MKIIPTILLMSLPLVSFGSSKKPYQRIHKQKDLYAITITNASPMPISPALVHASKASTSLIIEGSKATEGFSKICQSGDASTRIQELDADTNTIDYAQGIGLLFPGESVTLELTAGKELENIQLEAMYGKTVETCALINIQVQDLELLKKGIISEVQGQDRAVLSGVRTTADAAMIAQECQNETNAISCLRSVSGSDDSFVKPAQQLLPEVLNGLTELYETSDVLSVLAPVQGAVKYSLTKK